MLRVVPADAYNTRDMTLCPLQWYDVCDTHRQKLQAFRDLVSTLVVFIQQTVLSLSHNTLHSGIVWNPLHGLYHLLTNRGSGGAVLNEVRLSLLLISALPASLHLILLFFAV